MNILDVILGVIVLLGGLGGLILAICAFKDYEIEVGCLILFIGGLLAFFAGMPLLVLDKGSGATIGEITSVDKNFFGTTALYIKTSENSQEKYCIENKEVATQAAEFIGKKVKITYGERVGIYSTGRCHEAPVEKIEELED